MKFKLILAFAIFTSALFSQSSNRYSDANSYKLSVGFIAVDDSFSSENQLFNFKENWNFSRLPTRFAGEYLFTKNISVEAAFSYTTYDIGKRVDGQITQKELSYTAFDISGKYDLNGVLDLVLDVPYNFDPYIVGGIGLVSIKDYTRTSANLGGGANFWFWHESDYDFGLRQFYKRLGVFAQVQGRHDIAADPAGRQIQYSFGVISRF